MCGKLSDACEGDTSSAGEQCKDVCKATQHLPRPQTFFLLPLTHLTLRAYSHYSQEMAVGGQPENQGLNSSLFGVVIIHGVGSFIDAM